MALTIAQPTVNKKSGNIPGFGFMVVVDVACWTRLLYRFRNVATSGGYVA